MKYEGPIYGVGNGLNGRKIYFDTGRTSKEWDAMEAKIEELERENAALREMIGDLADCYFLRRNEGLLELMMAADRMVPSETLGTVRKAQP